MSTTLLSFTSSLSTRIRSRRMQQASRTSSSARVSRHYPRRWRAFLLTYVDIVWEDITKIAAIKFPQAVKSGQLSGSHIKKSKPGLSNSSKVEKVFGRKLKSLEAMVTDLTGQYLELLEKS